MKRTPLILAALICCAKPTPPENGENSQQTDGGGGKKTEQLVTPEELAQLRADSSALSGVKSRISSLHSTLISLGLAKPDDDALSIAGNIASQFGESQNELNSHRKGSSRVADVIEELFPTLITEGETVASISEKIIREHAEKCKGLPAANELVEGSSAIHIGADGKGVQSIYVIGVSQERGEVVIYATPPRIIPLKEVKAVKRGHPIADSERTQRENAFPGKSWDERKD